jgi:prepilin-type N-terminal cleavage/methylation domain-containing protein
VLNANTNRRYKTPRASGRAGFALIEPFDKLRTQAKGERKGFTLIELLVVIAVLGMLLAIGGGFATNLLTTSDRQETLATMKIVMQAVDVFYDKFGVYPPDRAAANLSSNSTPANSGEFLLKYLRGQLDDDREFEYVFGDTPANQAERDSWNKRIQRTTREILTGLSDKALPAGATAVMDAYGSALAYRQTSGTGGRPVLISAGGGADYDSDEAIRSDEN